MTKGRYRVFQAKLRATEVDPHFEKICVFAVLKRTSTATIVKYRFQNESALAHNLREAADSF